MSRRPKARGSAPAKVTADVGEALQTVAAGLPVVLVAADGAALGRLLRPGPDAVPRERLLAVMVGDPTDPGVVSAAVEMASELWPWALPLLQGA